MRVFILSFAGAFIGALVGGQVVLRKMRRERVKFERKENTRMTPAQEKKAIIALMAVNPKFAGKEAFLGTLTVKQLRDLAGIESIDLSSVGVSTPPKTPKTTTTLPPGGKATVKTPAKKPAGTRRAAAKKKGKGWLSEFIDGFKGN